MSFVGARRLVFGVVLVSFVGHANDDVSSAWQRGMLLMAGAAACAPMTLFVRERKHG